MYLSKLISYTAIILYEIYYLNNSNIYVKIKEKSNIFNID